MNSNKSKVVKNTSILYLRILITVFISLYTTRILVNVLGSSDFGLFTLVTSIIALFGFLSGTLSNTTQRFLSFSLGINDINLQKQVFSISLLFHYIVGFLVCFLLYFFSSFLFEHFLVIDVDKIVEAKKLYFLMIFCTFCTIISAPFTGVLVAHENMKIIALLGILESILRLVISILLNYYNSALLIVYGYSLTFISLILLLLKVIYCTYKYEEITYRLSKYFNISKVKEIMSFSGWSFLGVASTMITSQGQNLLLNRFFGTKINAAHGIAEQIRGQLSVLSNILMNTLNPVIIRSEGEGNRIKMIEYTLFGSRISFFLLMIVVIPISFELPIILKLWLKNVPELAIIFCRIILLRSLIEQIFIPLITAINATGKIKALNIWFFVISIFPLPLSWYLFSIGFPNYTIYLVYVLYSIIWSIVLIFTSNKLCKIEFETFRFQVVFPALKVFLLSILFSLSFALFFKESLLRLFIHITVFVFYSLLVIFRFGLFENEKVQVKNFIMKFLVKFKF